MVYDTQTVFWWQLDHCWKTSLFLSPAEKSSRFSVHSLNQTVTQQPHCSRQHVAGGASAAAQNRMHTKVDFVAEAEAQQPFRDVKVGQELHLSRQEDGSWSCNRLDGSCICQVPTAAAASLSAAAQHHHHHQGGTSTTATAVIRSVKRCPDNPEAAVSLQVRISFSQAQGVSVGVTTLHRAVCLCLSACVTQASVLYGYLLCGKAHICAS